MNKSYPAMLKRAFAAWISVFGRCSGGRGSTLRTMTAWTGLLVVAMFAGPANAQFAGADALFGSRTDEAVGVEQVAFVTPPQPEVVPHGDSAYTPAVEPEQTPIKPRVPDMTRAVESHGAVDLRQSSGVLQDLNQRIDGVARDAYAGVAAAMAVQTPGAFLPGKTVVRVGTAMFKGESALGVSMRRTSENSGWSLTGGVGVSRAGLAVALGAEWVFN